MKRKPWPDIRKELSPEQRAAVETKIAKLDRAEQIQSTDSARTMRSRTPRPRLVGVGRSVTPYDVALWIYAEDIAQPGFAAEIKRELTRLKRGGG